MTYQTTQSGAKFAGRSSRLPTKCGKPHPDAEKIVAWFNAGRSRKYIATELKTSGERVNATLIAAGVDLLARCHSNPAARPHTPLPIPNELLLTLPLIRNLARVWQNRLIEMHASGASNETMIEAFSEFEKPYNHEGYRRFTSSLATCSSIPESRSPNNPTE